MQAKRTTWVLMGLAIVVVAWLGLDSWGGDGVPQLARLEADATILAFGNSLTHGTGAPRDRSYPAQLSRRLRREVVNAGVPGEVSAQGRERLPNVLARVDPDLLILCHGGNDLLEDRDRAALRANLRAMVKDARERDVPVVLVGVPARGVPLATADLYYEIAAELDLPLVAEAIADIIGDSQLRSDRVHPNAAGYGRLTKAIHEVLARAGAVAPP